MAQKRQILSINGGGVRGLYSIAILAQIEQCLADQQKDENLNIGKYFDMISGTSIGGILAIGLASGINARSLYKTLLDNAANIFPPPMLSGTPILGAIFSILRVIKLILLGSRYNQKALKATLISVLGDKRIRDLDRRVIVPVINITNGQPSLIKTPHNEIFKRDGEYKVVDVCLGTSAAPTYFPPHKVNNHYWVDGGLIANNPTLISCHEAKYFLDWDLDNLYILSIGTLNSEFALNHKKINSWTSKFKGFLNIWQGGLNIIELTLSANQIMQNKMASHIIGERLVEVDEIIGKQQSDEIAIDIATKDALEMMAGRAEHKAHSVFANSKVKAFFKNYADEFQPF